MTTARQTRRELVSWLVGWVCCVGGTAAQSPIDAIQSDVTHVRKHRRTHITNMMVSLAHWSSDQMIYNKHMRVHIQIQPNWVACYDNIWMNSGWNIVPTTRNTLTQAQTTYTHKHAFILSVYMYETWMDGRMSHKQRILQHNAYHGIVRYYYNQGHTITIRAFMISINGYTVWSRVAIGSFIINTL